MGVDLVENERLSAEAGKLLAAARDEKRAARQHRNRAKQYARQFDELVALLRARGIEVEIQPHSPRRHSGNNDRNPTQA